MAQFCKSLTPQLGKGVIPCEQRSSSYKRQVAICQNIFSETSQLLY